MCRRWTGGPSFSTNAASVRFRGEENLQRYRSSDWAERGFCKCCGSSLFFHLKEQDHYIMNMGAIDDQSPFKVDSEIFIDEKPPGYDLSGTHPRLTGEEFLASMQGQ
jgi:hypothetical protein